MEVAKMYLSNLLVGLIFVYCSIYLAGFGCVFSDSVCFQNDYSTHILFADCHSIFTF